MIVDQKNATGGRGHAVAATLRNESLRNKRKPGQLSVIDRQNFQFAG
jgi:hypothetical protein